MAILVLRCDMILGSNEGCFSAGELTFITRDSILEEYCSCKKLIAECELWSEVISIWKANMNVSYEQYKQLRLRFERNKTTLRTLINHVWPTTAFKQYCQATLALFEAIQKVTGCSVIIDSSKSPQRIAVLAKIVDLEVVHLCRDFTGVLNSSSRSISKDIEAGIETDLPAGRVWKVTLNWLVTNIAAEIFCLGQKSIKIFYEKYVNKPESLKEIHPSFRKITGEQSFSASHMLAGNVIRLKKNLKINPSIGFQYKRLNVGRFRFGRMVDNLFRFWS
ncbi:hypothetical protein [Fodinibius sp. SL11]|uniref:hypothetical protein n=1 Tax=Fodinibius sp. SL11 TaxID=3425690 RepID=UPI003F881AAC